MSYVEEPKLYASIITSIHSNPFIQSKGWVKGFSILNYGEQEEIIKILHDLQKDSIILGMEQLDSTIHIPGLGRFVLNKGRKEFVELMRDQPELGIDAIKAKVLTNYIDRFKQSKQKIKWKVVK